MNIPDIVVSQVEWTRVLWQRIQAIRPGDQQALDIEFFFRAASQPSAIALQYFLSAETEYTSRVHAWEDEWKVSGVIPTMTVDLEMLEQWVDWMVHAGAHFSCIFDGWGAELAD